MKGIGKIISYWSNWEVISEEKNEHNPFFVIIGEYNHKNEQEKGRKAVGVCWSDYPWANVLAPLVLSNKTGFAILCDLLKDAINSKDDNKIKKLTNFIAELNEDSK